MSNNSKHFLSLFGTIVWVGIVLFTFSSCEKPDETPINTVATADSLTLDNDSTYLENDSTEMVNDSTELEDPVVLEYDTVFPGSYLPYYPGSYWDYIDSDGETSQVSVVDEYLLHSYNLYIAPWSESDAMSEPKYVPQLMDESIYYGYNKFVNYWSMGATHLFRTVIKEQLGGSIWTFTGNQYSQTYHIKTTTAVDTTVVVNGVSYYPTIEVSIYSHDTNELDEPALTGIEYYTKNVGLIKSIDIDLDFNNPVPPVITNEKTLTNYFIGE